MENSERNQWKKVKNSQIQILNFNIYNFVYYMRNIIFLQVSVSQFLIEKNYKLRIFIKLE